MKLKIQNMIGIQSAVLDLPAPLTLVSSDENAIGKSSIMDAVRFIIGGAPRGIKAKSRFRDCIRDGAAAGKVGSTIFGAQRVRQIKTGEYTAGGPLSGLNDNPGWQFSVDPENVGRAQGKELLGILLQVSEADMSAERVAEQLLLVDHVTKEHVDELRPRMAGSLDLVASTAKELASEARGAWKQLTGENFGSEKSDGWTPTVSERDPADLSESVDALQIRIAEVEPQAQAQGFSGPCPHCNEMVSYRDGGFHQTPAQEESAPEMWEELQRLRAQLSEAERELEAATGADELAKQAQDLYVRVMAFAGIAKALEPDGIPSKLAKKAMEPVRHRLSQHASALGWLVDITPEGEITLNGRHYGLLSPSEKWRAQVIVAEVVSYMAKTGLLLVDQFDCIAPGERSKWVKFFVTVSKSRECMMVAYAATALTLTSNKHWNMVWVKDSGAEVVLPQA